MSGTDATDSLIERAIHEAGHYFAGMSMGIGVPVWLTIQPLGDSGGQCSIAFTRDRTIEEHIHYCIGGLCSQMLYALGNSATVMDETNIEQVANKILDLIKDDSKFDIVEIKKHKDFSPAAFGRPAKRCINFLASVWSEVVDLAFELIGQKTLHLDEADFFLHSHLRWYRAQRRAYEGDPELYDKVKGLDSRPDLELREPTRVFLNREPAAIIPWSKRFNDAYLKSGETST